jgi:hypothetical protein
VDTTRLNPRCRSALRDVRIPRPFDLVRLCDELSARRDRPIVLLPFAMPAPGPCGMWLAGDTADYVLYERHTSRLHQEHIALHEIGHILLGHPGRPALSDDLIRRVFPSLAPAVVRRILARARYASQEEQDAEMIATTILRDAKRAGPAALAADPTTAAVLARLEAGIDPGRQASGGTHG